MSPHETNATAVDCDAQVEIPDHLKDTSHLHLETIAPNQLDAKYEASKFEFWAYCGWFMGNSSLALYTLAPIAFQNLLSQAAGSSGILHFGGRWIVFPLHWRLRWREGSAWEPGCWWWWQGPHYQQYRPPL